LTNIGAFRHDNGRKEIGIIVESRSDVMLVGISTRKPYPIPLGMQQPSCSNAVLLHAQGHCADDGSPSFATDIACLTAFARMLLHA